MSYYSDNRDAVLAYKKKYYAENREKIAAKKKAAYLLNQEKIRLAAKEKYAANPGPAKEQAKRWAKANPERKAEKAREWTNNNREKMRESCRRSNSKRRRELAGEASSRAKWILENVVLRARKKGLIVSITIEWLTEKLTAGVCEATGLQLSLTSIRGARTPSIDRIDPAKGYTPDNCRIVCFIFNLAKNSFSDDDVEEMARAFIAKRTS